MRELVEQELPFIKKCHARRVRHILRDTRKELSEYRKAHQVLRSERYRRLQWSEIASKLLSLTHFQLPVATICVKSTSGIANNRLYSCCFVFWSRPPILVRCVPYRACYGETSVAKSYITAIQLFGWGRALFRAPRPNASRVFGISGNCHPPAQ